MRLSPLLFLSSLTMGLAWSVEDGAQANPVVSELRAPESFANIGDRAERARAIFLEVSRVLFHPRCANCHPAGDSPLQGDDQHLHDPPIARGSDDQGVPALRCGSCHQDHNQALARVPGAPSWRLAPRSMAWVGLGPRALCEQLKDPRRNGGRALAQIAEHLAHDALVAWGWAPGVDLSGRGRVPAPGSQARLAALVAAWIELGAACPLAEEKPR